MSSSPTGDGTICPVCSAENPVGSRFCERCGTRLPMRPREAASEPALTESTPPPGRDEATITFQQLPPDPAPRQPQEPAASETPAEPEVFERTLIGTPPLTDFVREERASADDWTKDSGPPEETKEAPPADAEPPAVPPAPMDESLRDRATMTFQLPDLSTPSSESRNAATVSFDLPKLPTEDRPAAEGAAERTVTPPASNQPGEDRWSYQSWRPGSAANQPPPGGTSESGGLRPSGDADEAAPQASAPPASPGALPSTAAPPPAAPPARQESTSEGPPSGYPPAAQGPQSPPSTPAWPPAGGPPTSVTYPSVSAGQSQSPPAYGQPPAAAPRPSGYPTAAGSAQPGMTAYPTPVEPKNNRALWIILGIIAAVIFICVVGCILLALLGAIGGAGASSSFATVVPTVTR